MIPARVAPITHAHVHTLALRCWPYLWEGNLAVDVYTPITIGGHLVNDKPGEIFTGQLSEVRMWRQPCTADSVRRSEPQP